MFDVFKIYLARIVAGILFGAIGSVLVAIGVTETELMDFILGLLSGGTSIAIILATIKKAVLSDPEEFKRTVARKRME